MFFNTCLHTITSPKACRKFKEALELLASLLCSCSSTQQSRTFPGRELASLDWGPENEMLSWEDLELRM